ALVDGSRTRVGASRGCENQRSGTRFCERGCTGREWRIHGRARRGRVGDVEDVFVERTRGDPAKSIHGEGLSAADQECAGGDVEGRARTIERDQGGTRVFKKQRIYGA